MKRTMSGNRRVSSAVRAEECALTFTARLELLDLQELGKMLLEKLLLECVVHALLDLAPRDVHHAEEADLAQALAPLAILKRIVRCFCWRYLESAKNGSAQPSSARSPGLASPRLSRSARSSAPRLLGLSTQTRSRDVSTCRGVSAPVEPSCSISTACSISDSVAKARLTRGWLRRTS